MSVSDVAGLISALAFVLLVGFIAYPLVKLGKVLEETRRAVRGLSDGTLPLLEEVTTTVSTANQQMARVDTITEHVESVSANVSSLAALFTATVGSPLIKVAAFGHGLRRATSGHARRGRGKD
ncbi:MAG: hypothetical protein QG608_429 [Actinomycetota bacterium]|nr:hypothetical protein [Actinomycetota bacterium]